jgi:hypothetical protein
MTGAWPSPGIRSISIALVALTVDPKQMVPITLNGVIEAGVKRFTYTYDFGDDWRHVISIGQSEFRRARRPFAAPPVRKGASAGFAFVVCI